MPGKQQLDGVPKHCVDTDRGTCNQVQSISMLSHYVACVHQEHVPTLVHGVHHQADASKHTMQVASSLEVRKVR